MTMPIVERLRDRLKVSQATEDEAADTIERMTEALTAVRAYYFLANPMGLSDAYVCDLVCDALAKIEGEV